jgi:hypothetical protein
MIAVFKVWNKTFESEQKNRQILDNYWVMVVGWDILVENKSRFA